LRGTAIYDALWQRGKSALRHGPLVLDEPPVPGSSRWGLSAVIALSDEIAGRLAEEVERLRAIAGRPHLYYDRASFHLTVRSLEGYRTTVPPADIAEYLTGVSEAAVRIRPKIEMRGLCAGESGVLACGFADADMDRLRTRLTARAAAHGRRGPAGVDDERVRDTLHASLMVFRQQRFLPDLADYIESRRSWHFGSFVPDAIRLVQYEWTSDGVRMSQVGAIDL
jgi:hypothetical protein